MVYTRAKIVEKYGAENVGPTEALLGQTSKVEFLFLNKLSKIGDEEAIKLFNACPHMEALEERGRPEERKSFCRDMLANALCHLRTISKC